MSAYTGIRFIGYPIPTDHQTEITVGQVGNMMIGTYLGENDTKDDIAKRMAVLRHAVETAKAALPTSQTPGTVLNVFIAPEFFWHGTQGPYLHEPGEPDPAELILDAMDAAFPADEYADWLIIGGSVISAPVADKHALWSQPTVQVRNATVRALTEQYRKASGALKALIYDMLRGFVVSCHMYPNVEVHNRSLVLSRIPMDGVRTPIGATRLTTEKYYDSNEDFLLYDVTGRTDVVTEQMTAYPVLDLTGGDDKTSADDPYSIFRHSYPGGQYADIGVEICLDHSDERLRRNIESPAWPAAPAGLHLHLIPSCGMQLSLGSLAAGAGGWAFNCDGEYAIAGDHPTGKPVHDSPNGVDSVYVDVVSPVSPHYSGHTQLAHIATATRGLDSQSPASVPATFETLDVGIVSIHPVSALDDLSSVFAGGPGALHIYGLETPLPYTPSKG